MHELGIVFHIIDSIEEVGRQNKLRRVSTVTLELPAPDTLAPQAFRKFCRSTISGSRAALEITVVPSAPQAASIRFSVAPTEGRLSISSLPAMRAAVQ